MKYLILMHVDPEVMASLSLEQQQSIGAGHQEFMAKTTETGEMLSTHALGDPSQTKVVRGRNGMPETVDGPFAETKEFMGGYYLLDVESEERAIELGWGPAARSRAAGPRRAPAPLRHRSAGRLRRRRAGSPARGASAMAARRPPRRPVRLAADKCAPPHDRPHPERPPPARPGTGLLRAVAATRRCADRARRREHLAAPVVLPSRAQPHRAGDVDTPRGRRPHDGADRPRVSSSPKRRSPSASAVPRPASARLERTSRLRSGPAIDSTRCSTSST